MMSPDKTGLLKAFLGGLPGHVAARLAQAVEMDRLMDGAVLPHEEILLGLRPVLRQAHPQRTPTPLRLFCEPVQDLLSSEPRKEKQKAVIARSSILPVWTWLGGTLLAAETAAYVGDMTLVQSLWAIATARGLCIHVTILPAQGTHHADRRALATLLESDIGGALASQSHAAGPGAKP